MGQTDEDHADARDQSRWSLQALAMDTDVQRSLFPDFVCKADELALDYGHWFEVARSRFASDFTNGQLHALHVINLRLEAMSRLGPEFDAGLWTEAALGSRLEWAELRSLSRCASAVELACRDASAEPLGLCPRQVGWLQ